jgi:hypothetical protein
MLKHPLTELRTSLAISDTQDVQSRGPCSKGTLGSIDWVFSDTSNLQSRGDRTAKVHWAPSIGCFETHFFGSFTRTKREERGEGGKEGGHTEKA